MKGTEKPKELTEMEFHIGMRKMEILEKEETEQRDLEERDKRELREHELQKERQHREFER